MNESQESLGRTWTLLALAKPHGLPARHFIKRSRVQAVGIGGD